MLGSHIITINIILVLMSLLNAAQAWTSTRPSPTLTRIAPSLVSRSLVMQQKAGGGGGRGGTQLDNRTKQKTSTKPTFKEEIEKDWRYIEHEHLYPII